MSWYHVLETPLGPLFVGGSERGLHRVDFLREGKADALDEAYWVDRVAADSGERPRLDAALAAPATRQLREYFEGERTEFDLPLAPVGSEWQRSVWSALLEIPHGTTTTYGALAAQLGRRSAARAVGASVGRNPLAVIIPCHRVVGATGALTGYAGGLDRKRWLLNLEAQALRLAG